MSKALIAGINQVAVDKGLEREVIFEAIEAALVSAYKRNYGSVANVTAAVDRASGEMSVFAEKEVVEGVLNERTEIELEAARSLKKDAVLHDVLKIKSTPNDFGRIAAQTAKQVILQRIREAERDTVFENFVHRVGETINAQVRSVDTVSSAVTVLLNEKHESLLPRDEQIPNERLRRGDYVRLYIVDVQRGSRGPMIKLSRTHRNLLRRLMEQEIPEVREGTVEIKNIAREPGARSKVAVVATIPNVDAVGSCVGMRGMRIQNIVTELAGEKIDVVEWSTDPRLYIANSLSPAKVSSVLLNDSGEVKTATVIVPDRQLSLAIGKAGQNARLAAKLTGWRIDIKSESEAMDEGIDLLAAEQAQRKSSIQGDVLSMAEEILQRQEDMPVSDQGDVLDRAAQFLKDQDSETAEDEMPDFSSDLTSMFGSTSPSTPSSSSIWEEAARKLEEPAETPSAITDDIFRDAVEKVQQEMALSHFSEKPDVDSATDEAIPTTDEPASKEVDTAARDEPLPAVITADMLRARRGKKINVEDMDFEIPAELLAGLYDKTPTEIIEDDEDLDELHPDRQKGRRRPVKPKAAAKTTAKKPTKSRKPSRPGGRGDFDDLD